MFWIFLIIVGTSTVFIQLGSLSVWASVFRFGLLLALLVIAILIVIFIWNHFKDKISFNNTFLAKRIKKHLNQQ